MVATVPTPIRNETPTDAQLVERTRNGDPSAFAVLVQRHERAVLAIAASLLGDRAEAQDMAQETFLRAHRNLGLLADPARFGPWVKRVAFGACVDWLRAFRPRFYQSIDDDAAAELASDSPTPLEHV